MRLGVRKMALIEGSAPRNNPGSGVRGRLRRLSAFFRSNVYRGAAPARASQLIFEPLEQRLLLNGDVQALTLDLSALAPSSPAHDVVVQLVNQIATTGQPAAQPTVEIVEATNPNQILASAPLSQISAISIHGSSGADQVTINEASFAGTTAPSISFTGGGGNETLTINNGTAPAGQAPINNWFIDSDVGGATSGHVTGSVNVSFSGVNNLQGSGADTLQGATTDNNWTIDGAGAGEVGSVSFSGFANLVGAANQNNVFTVTSTGSIAGTIDGGGQGTLVAEVGNAGTVISDLSGPHSGTESFNGETITYTGMLPYQTTGTVANFQYVISTDAGALTPQADSVVLYYDSSNDAYHGDMVLESLDGAFETQYFTAPTQSLTITGGSGADSLTIESLAPGFSASLNVDLLYTGFDPFSDRAPAVERSERPDLQQRDLRDRQSFDQWRGDPAHRRQHLCRHGRQADGDERQQLWRQQDL